MDLKNIKSDYDRKELNKEDLSENPTDMLMHWMQEAISRNVLYPNAVTISTVSKEGFPSSRMVLSKEIKKDGIYLFSNYLSQKGKEISENPQVSLLFFWKELDKQVRIQGVAKKNTAEESEKYFRSRSYDAQISAIASKQSSPVSKDDLHQRVKDLKNQYPEKEEIPYPSHWGGYIIEIISAEFWQGRPNRLHDRFLYQKENHRWHTTRLSP